MPTYEYQCTHCGFLLEEFQSISEAPLSWCPRCSRETLARVIGGGAGVIFKGSGFYLTDYRKGAAAGGTGGKEEKPKGSTDSGQA